MNEHTNERTTDGFDEQGMAEALLHAARMVVYYERVQRVKQENEYDVKVMLGRLTDDMQKLMNCLSSDSDKEIWESKTTVLGILRMLESPTLARHVPRYALDVVRGAVTYAGRWYSVQSTV